ncbi:hypothetical protein [Nonomuraea soli]|uniref:DUF4386 family protein n=1 Tax=Nonomuraea soli TaxID=1032476 RepID=A0A7W0CE46_9ACTN|nr:hypothetical protein [Nonomuraea soli]MBA2889325.1 hypothetical protein [Nonomuraea soli]
MLSDHISFRRTVSGILLILAPLLQAVAVMVDPGTWGDDRETVSFGDNPALAQVQSVLYHWSWILLAIGALGLIHLTRRSHFRSGHILGAITVVGYINASGLLLTDPVEWWLGQHYPPERAQQILEEMMGLPGPTFGFQMPWMFMAILGLPLLLVVVWRAGHAPWWVPLVTAAGYLGTFAVPYGPATVPMWTAPVVAIGWIGVRILRMSDEAWASFYAPGRTTPASYAKTTA